MDSLKGILDNMQIEFTAEYLQQALMFMLIAGVAAAAFMIVSAARAHKHLGLAITGGIFQIIAGWAQHQLIVTTLTTDFYFQKTYYGSTIEEAQQKANEGMRQFLADSVGPMLLMGLCSALLFVAWILTLVFIIRMLKKGNKGLVIPALIIYIIRGFIPTVIMAGGMFGDGITEEMLMQCNYFNAGGLVLALLMVMIGVLVKKPEPETAAAAQPQPEVIEQPAEPAPVQDMENYEPDLQYKAPTPEPAPQQPENNNQNNG